MGLEQFFPPLETALTLEPEELAISLLNTLIQQEKGAPTGTLHLSNFVGSPNIDSYAGDKSTVITKKITEVWIWLEQELMLAPTPGKSREWLYVTEKGYRFASDSDITKYKASNIIPPSSLDPVLASKVLPLFIRGDYNTAVFQSFKEVEIRVRNVASLPAEEYGTDLMRKVFHPKTGVLTDTGRPMSERQAASDLFAGAIGLFKNPSSHRDVDWEDPIECAELIYLANHLLRIVEKHKQAKSTE